MVHPGWRKHVIFHNLQAIFIHIPKTAGTSLTRVLSGGRVWPQDANYHYLTGWCPDRKIWLQHATPTQLLQTGLVTTTEWDQYQKFTIVRNPFDRALSDFYWMRSQVGHRGTFRQYLKGTGPFTSVLDQSTSRYRGDHLRPQVDFLHLAGEPIEFEVFGRFEHLQKAVEQIALALQFNVQDLPHEKRRKGGRPHYSHFYSDLERAEVASKYQADLESLGYVFDDQRGASTRLTRPIRRIRAAMVPRMEMALRQTATALRP